MRLIEEDLFEISDCNSDVLYVNRPTPCFTLFHDTVFVFSTYKDTIAFLDFRGNVLRKIYHELGYPSYLYYNNERERLYFLNTGIKGEIKRTYIYEFDREGRLLDSTIFTIDWTKWWIISGAMEKKELQNIRKILRKNKIGGKNPYIVVDVVSDIQTVWNNHIILARRDGVNKNYMIPMSGGMKVPFTIQFKIEPYQKSLCEKENHIWGNHFNLRKGYCSNSLKNKLFRIFQYRGGFFFCSVFLKPKD